MTITYKCGGKIFDTSISDDNLTITEKTSGSRKTVSVKANADVELLRAVSDIAFKVLPDDRIFANGYQSWTETNEFKFGEKLNDLNKLPKKLVEHFAFKAYGSQGFAPIPKDSHISFDIMYTKGRNPLFIGSYNYKNAYLMIYTSCRKNNVRLVSDVNGRRLDKGCEFTVFDYILEEKNETAFEDYLLNLTPKTRKKLLGYTSWYNHYQNINESVILSALENSDPRFDLFQIDDGFEPFVGDWLKCDEKKFPNGLGEIVDKIHDKKMLAGIWLAPFVAEKDSQLFKEHSDYISKDARGDFVRAGNNWSGSYALDLNNADAVEYIRAVLRHYVELGFDFFKLDFLYASNLCPIKGKTRAETAEFAYSLLAEELNGKIILGCGATITNGFERFDYMRIGPDVSLIFDDQPYMRLLHPERISTKVTLRNTIFRSPLNGKAFGNDPDVFLLRDSNIKMSKQQRYALGIINALFGSVLMTSDNIKDYDDEKRTVLDKMLMLSENAVNVRYERRSSLVEVNYELNGKPHKFLYDMKKGIITDER